MLKRFDIVQIKMTGEELRDVTLARSGDLKKICPYFNVGYCRYRDHCKHIHPSENCGERNCTGKNCTKRHRKLCRYGENCCRISSCEFLHQEQSGTYGTDADLKSKQESLEKLIKIKDEKFLSLPKRLNFWRLQWPKSKKRLIDSRQLKKK